MNREIDRQQSIIAKQDMALESLYFDLNSHSLGVKTLEKCFTQP